MAEELGATNILSCFVLRLFYLASTYICTECPYARGVPTDQVIISQVGGTQPAHTSTEDEVLAP